MTTRAEVLNLIDDGTFVGVTFVKADGTIRELNGRIGVKKHLKGGTKAFDDADYGLITIFDRDVKGYRSFKVERLKEIRAHGEVYTFNTGENS